MSVDPWRKAHRRHPKQGSRSARRTPALPPSVVCHADALPCRRAREIFFAEFPHDVERAKALCGGCPVRQACLAGALERREPWGVWGGEVFVDGVVVPRKRGRGRPRKAEVAA